MNESTKTPALGQQAQEFEGILQNAEQACYGTGEGISDVESFVSELELIMNGFTQSIAALIAKYRRQAPGNNT